MTATLVKGKKKGNFVIKATTLMWCKHTGFGELQYGEEAVEDAPHMNQQWSVDLLINKEVAKALKAEHKQFSKKEWTPAEFKKTFKIDPPFEAEEYITCKVYKEAYFSKSGDEGIPVKVVDAQRNSLADIEVGNGSTGDVVINIGTYDNKWGKGTSVRLSAIKVTDLIEYSGNDATDEFDFDEDEEFEAEDSAPTQAEESSSDSEAAAEESWED
jgi:hypothetical protein